MKQIRSIILILLGGASAAFAAPTQRTDLWYTLLLSDKPSGWSHQEVFEKKGILLSVTETHLAMRRGAIQIQIITQTRFSETQDGQPLEASITQKLGNIKTHQTMRFTKQGIELISRQQGREIRQQLSAASHAWLPPMAVQRYIQKQISLGAEKISFWTLDPSSGPNPMQITMQDRGRANVEVLGKVLPARVWDTQMSLLPGMVSQTWLNADGLPLKTTVSPMPGMTLTMVLADKQLALNQIDPPQLLVSTMVHPDRPLPMPRQLKHVRYELSIDADKATGAAASVAKIPQTDMQKTRLIDKWHLQIDVDLAGKPKFHQNAPGEPGEPVGLEKPGELEKPSAKYLRPTPTLNHADPKIQALIQRAVGGLSASAGPLVQARVLRRFVHRYIRAKDLSVGFATASEVAQTAQGDCSEHAVLLAAMLRGRAIPSRLVSGLIYVDQFLGQRGVFGYHMWTQAWIDGCWVDLDATLPTRDFDAAHIALALSSTDQGQVFNDMVKMLPLIGRIKIKILSAR